MTGWEELAALWSATVYEAAGRQGLVDETLVQVVAGSRAAGPARTVRCGQDDNLMAHAVMDGIEPGDVVVLTMPEPVWARWVRVRGATKTKPGVIGEPVEVGGCTIRSGDAVVLDADGAAVVSSGRVGEVLEAARRRAEKEREKRAALQGGALSYDLDDLRALVEGN